MRVLVLGDIVGESGVAAVQHFVPILRNSLALDCVIVNGENARKSGFGIDKKTCEDLRLCGVDVITLGNHAWDGGAPLDFMGKDGFVLRPLNDSSVSQGRGYGIFFVNGFRIMVVSVLGKVFMSHHNHAPLPLLDRIIEKNVPKQVGLDAIIVDIHAEAATEKIALGHVLDGRVTLLVGTHTHVPTADGRILPKGTGFQTDAGMCGCYDSVAGMEKNSGVSAYLMQEKVSLRVAEGEGAVSGVVVETDPKTGLAKFLWPVRQGKDVNVVFPF